MIRLAGRALLTTLLAAGALAGPSEDIAARAAAAE